MPSCQHCHQVAVTVQFFAVCHRYVLVCSDSAVIVVLVAVSTRDVNFTWQVIRHRAYVGNLPGQTAFVYAS